MIISIFDDLYRLNREMNRLLYSETRTGTTTYWPEVNIYGNDNEYMVVAKVPGVDKNDIAISLKDNSLKISGEKKSVSNPNANYHMKERKTGKFERNFVLDEKVDVDKINAEIKNGLLLIKIPKKPETKPVKIEIK